MRLGRGNHPPAAWGACLAQTTDRARAGRFPRRRRRAAYLSQNLRNRATLLRRYLPQTLSIPAGFEILTQMRNFRPQIPRTIQKKRSRSCSAPCSPCSPCDISSWRWRRHQRWGNDSAFERYIARRTRGRN